MDSIDCLEPNTKNELQVLLSESSRLHEDRRMWDNNIFRLFSLLLTISAACLAAVIQVRTKSLPSNISDSFNWDILVIAYPYVIYAFTFIFLVLNGAISHNSAYLVIIEERINRLVGGEPILIWESKIAQKSFYSIGSSYLYATLLVVVSVLVLSIYCIVLSLNIFRGSDYYTGYIIINSIAGSLILALLTYTAIFEKKRIFRLLKGEIKREVLNKRRRKNH